MEQVQIAHAKANFSALLERVEAGEEIVIARRGKAIARLIPESRSRQTAAGAFSRAWALGGLKIERAPKLMPDTSVVDLD
jgi:prevent-host-death family protein